MAEGTYEYECNRADLLGVARPDFEEFERKRKEREEAQAEEADVENLKEAETGGQALGGIAGKLHELNSLLASTQKKISRFKISHAPLTNLLKFGSRGSSADSVNASTAEISFERGCTSSQQPIEPSTTTVESEKTEVGYRKGDLTKALDGHVDKLDALIDSAENAQYSMMQQRGEMSKFLRK